MARINVIILNGKPRSGKDTVVRCMRRYCDDTEYAWLHHFSTIDPVKSALRNLGWDGEKTDEVRNMLAQLKQFWVQSCDGALRYCIDKVYSVINDKKIANEDHVIVFQIREPDEIEKLVNALKPMHKAYDMNCVTLFINRLEAEANACTNSADENVGDYLYDEYIKNNGTEDDLEAKVYDYLDILLEKKRGE